MRRPPYKVRTYEHSFATRGFLDAAARKRGVGRRRRERRGGYLNTDGPAKRLEAPALRMRAYVERYDRARDERAIFSEAYALLTQRDRPTTCAD